MTFHNVGTVMSLQRHPSVSRENAVCTSEEPCGECIEHTVLVNHPQFIVHRHFHYRPMYHTLNVTMQRFPRVSLSGSMAVNTVFIKYSCSACSSLVNASVIIKAIGDKGSYFLLFTILRFHQILALCMCVPCVCVKKKYFDSQTQLNKLLLDIHFNLSSILDI